jgi:hypothetical protein
MHSRHGKRRNYAIRQVTAPAPHKGSPKATTKITSAGSRWRSANSTIAIPDNNMMAACWRPRFFSAARGAPAFDISNAPQALQKRSIGPVSAWHDLHFWFAAGWLFTSFAMACSAPLPADNARREPLLASSKRPHPILLPQAGREKKSAIYNIGCRRDSLYIRHPWPP